MVDLIDKQVINNRAAQQVFEIVARTGDQPSTIVEREGLTQLGSSQELEALIQKIIADNPQQVTEYRSGKTKLWGFFVGQAMAQTQGRAHPQIINDLLKKYLA